MPSTLFYNARLCAEFGTLDPGWLLVEDSRITRLGSGRPPRPAIADYVDLNGNWLAPGLIDLHAHGAVGYDTMDATPEALAAMARFYAQHGVTGFLAATVTASHKDILAALSNTAHAMQQDMGGAALLGAHVEGPYLAVDCAGAQDATHIRPGQREEMLDMLSTGAVRLITLAPEVEANREIITWATQRGVIVSIGHTEADYETVRSAVMLGARHMTHTFNRMGILHHRSPGALGAALTVDALTCELIADNIHLHPAILQLTVRAKETTRIVLVTDAMRGAGMPDGTYMLGGVETRVEEGVARTQDGSLAGSTLTMERAVANMMSATGLDLSETLDMASLNPARELGLSHRKGSLAVNKDADLVILDSNLNVLRTMVQGRTVYPA